MRLYKSELYKLCSRKRFLFGTVGVLTLFLIYFWVQLTSISRWISSEKIGDTIKIIKILAAKILNVSTSRNTYHP